MERTWSRAHMMRAATSCARLGVGPTTTPCSMTRSRTPPADALSQLHGAVRRYRLDDALAKLGQIYLALHSRDNREQLPAQERNLWPQRVNGHQLAYVTKALIRGSNDYKAEILRFPKYLDLADLFNAAQGGEMSDTDDLRSWQLFFLRTAFPTIPTSGSPVDTNGALDALVR